jgi:hypothetical protein
MLSLKIIFSICIAFLVAFTSLFVFLYWFPDSNQHREREFFTQEFDPKINKIFLIGSSHVGMLNTTLINEKIQTDYSNYHVYNLAYSGDVPDERIKTINKIISLKPRIVLYGISYRDFESQNTNQILPNTYDLIDYIQTKNFAFQFDIPNPKLTTLTMVHDYTKSHKLSSRESGVIFADTPFFQYLPSYDQISTSNQLEEMIPLAHFESVHLDPPSKNKEVIALQEMIDLLHKNNIKIVIFTTPHQKFFVDGVPQTQKEIFNSILQYLNANSNVKIYDLTDKYADLPIWLNIEHVAYNPASSIYSNDIANIILNESENHVIQ